MRTWIRPIITLVLLCLGLDFWMVVAHGEFGSYRLLNVLGVIVLISAIWPLDKFILRISKRVDRIAKRSPIWVAIFVTAAVAVHLFAEAHRFRGELYLKFHDEHVYLIQAHMLLRGRLWMHAYPPSLTDFFDSFYLIVDRVYAGMYPPGVALMMTPAVWLRLAYWIMPILAGIAAAGFFFLVWEEMFGAVKAFVGVLLLVSLTTFMSMSFMVLSEAPFLLSQAICFWAWMRWRRGRRAGWLALLGAAAGYGTITRPADMFCVASAIGIAIVFELRRQPRALLKTTAIIIAAGSPFLAIWITQNIGVTGKWDESAVRYYTDHNYPEPILSFRHVDASDVPPTHTLIKKTEMAQWILPVVQWHSNLSLPRIWYPDRIQILVEQTLPTPMLWILLPAAVISLREIRRAAVFGFVLFFLVLYTADGVFLPHYMLAIAPAVIGLILMGWESLERAYPPIRPAISTFLMLSVISAAVNAVPELNPWSSPMTSPTQEQNQINRIMGSLPRRPSLVLFRFDPEVNSYHTDPVYNDDVAWPDDALIVRARDLGKDRNPALYRYYAGINQNRDVYLFDRGALGRDKNPLTHLGTVRQLTGG